ncbi:MAG: hypothetical protein OES38_14520, partial [Gammaproteobacteria bacterium]|nr:hypothetical protein [Gammaproteobacteria bacterium]
ARALPDGEIARGVPMPAVVPLPGKPMAPMPGGNVTVKPKYVGARADGGDVGSLSVIDRDGRSPGYPFWTAGMEELVGQRPPTPPLDMLTVAKAQELAASGTCVKADPDDLTCIELWDEDILVGGAGGWDGGLPRHGLQGYMEGGESVSVQNRLDFTKVIETAKPVYYPEEGTDLEQLAMAFHAKPEHPSYALNKDGTPVAAPYVTNGMLPAPSAPYFEPCRADDGQLVEAGGSYNFYGADGLSFNAPATFGAKNPRTYKGANLQIDADLTKTGYHFSQQRILTLWGDVLDTINKVRPPEPFVMRANTMDCVKYLHANLVPEYYEMDDYQVRTPTDIIGQHIHLPKWDLVANDGSGNGWNYEDGTLSPGMVRERIHAINHFNELAAPADQVATLDGRTVLAEQPHPFADFSPANDPHWLGARTTIQRWFTDPVVNLDDEDRGLGIVFTHDHYGPSTFQQVGLYSTILAEPIGSKWSHNETGSPLGVDNDIDPTATTANGHLDGGPTSWQAIIETADGSDSWREFYFEFGDFSHAYEKGTFVGANAQGKSIVNPLTGPFVEPDHFTHSPITFEGVGGPGSEPALIVARGPAGPAILPGHTIAPTALDGTPAPQTFLASINPSFRQEPVDQNKVFPDIVRYPPNCPHVVAGVQINDIPRPCPEAISADDPGMLTANYRAEPVGLRVYDPNKVGPDGHAGQQADGLAGDLAFALQTRTDRAIPEMNTTHGVTTYVNKLNYGVEPGDPFTPMMRTYPEDKVKIKIQSGATEHEHSATIHGIKWMQSGSGNGIAPNSGWRNAQNDGISEQFTFTAPIRNDPQKLGDSSDYAYALDAGQDGWWSGVWGLLRTYDEVRADLATLPTNEDGVVKKNRIANLDDFDGVCPINAPVKDFTVVAVAANDVLKNDVGAQLLPNDANKRDMHVGAAVDDAGGTLVYNNRDTVGQYGELHDPTAMLYVMLEDLEPQPDFAGTNQCRDRRNNIGVLNPECPVQLKANAPVEPIALRAAAGDCLKVTLHNRIPEVAYDLPGFNTLLQIVNRRVDATGSLRTFQNNLIRPSSHVGLHPQMVEYDVTRHDGTNVGLNGSEINGDTGEREFTELTTVPPVNANGDPGDPVTYTWYAGDLALVPNPDATNLCPGNGKPKNDCDLIVAATPIEFGGFNLNPADKVKQGQKGLIGTAVIEPLGSSWPTALADLEDVKDHQAAAGGTDTRKTRAQLVVTRADGTTFKDASLVFQKGLNHRAGNDGTAIPNIASEGRGIPEDSHDAGQMAINYGTEPMWFRFGLAADAPFGNDPNGLGTVQNSHEAYSNNLAGAGDDPVTPIVTATAGDELRLRVTMPTGSGRGTTFQVDGHAWQRDPYVCRDDLDGYGDGDPSHNGLTGKCDPNQGYTQTGSAASQPVM